MSADESNSSSSSSDSSSESSESESDDEDSSGSSSSSSDADNENMSNNDISQLIDTCVSGNDISNICRNYSDSFSRDFILGIYLVNPMPTTYSVLLLHFH